MSNQTQPQKLSTLELSAFCEQMAMILTSGISASEGISLLLEDASNEAEKELLNTIYDTLLDTGQLHLSLEKSGVFPDYLLRMIEIGEETGTLDEVMDSLSRHYNREEAISRSIRNALTYPFIMVGMMLFIIIILITKVMPVFNQVFRQLGQEMHGLSKGILLLGNTLSKYAFAFVMVTIVIILFLLYLTHTKNGHKILFHLGQHFHFSKDIYDKMSACRFAGGMALALKSGLTPEQGLNYSEHLVNSGPFADKIHSIQKRVAEGCDLSDALREADIFTGIHARMISIAGKAGMMDEVMGQIADQCEEEVNDKIISFISVLEPTLVILLSVIVGIILLSVMLPLLGIMSGL